MEDVCHLVDKDDFLSDLYQLRKKCGLGKKLEQYSPNRENPDRAWFFYPWGQDYKEVVGDLKHTVNADEIYENFFMDLRKLRDSDEDEFEKKKEQMKNELRKSKKEDFRFDIQDLTAKFRRPPYFDQIIAHSLLYGEVFNNSFVRCEAKIEWPELEFPDVFGNPQLILRVYPYTTKEELSDVFQKELPKLFPQYQELYQTPSYPAIDKRRREKGEIKIHRFLYWEWKKSSNKSFKKLADNLTDKLIELCPVHGNHSDDEEIQPCNFCKDSWKDITTLRRIIINYQSWLNSS